MEFSANYPTIEHEKAATTVVNFFSNYPGVEAVLLIGSCTRGKASRESCLDFLVLVAPEALMTEKTAIEQQWKSFYELENIFKALLKVGKYSHVDLDFIDGRFVPRPRDWTSGPDEFELEIGNTLKPYSFLAGPILSPTINGLRS